MTRNPKSQRSVPLGDVVRPSLSSRFGEEGAARSGKQFLWSDANPVLVAEAISRVTRSGDAVMFGSTFDRGAGVLTVLAGDERRRFYPATFESADQALQQVSYAYSTAEERRDFPSSFNPIGGKR